LIDALEKLVNINAKTTIYDTDLDEEVIEALKEVKLEKVQDILSLDKEAIVSKLMGKETAYSVAYGKSLRVKDGDFVMAGDRLTEGPLDPHKPSSVSVFPAMAASARTFVVS